MDFALEAASNGLLLFFFIIFFSRKKLELSQKKLIKELESLVSTENLIKLKQETK